MLCFGLFLLINFFSSLLIAYQILVFVFKQFDINLKIILFGLQVSFFSIILISFDAVTKTIFDNLITIQFFYLLYFKKKIFLSF